MKLQKSDVEKVKSTGLADRSDTLQLERSNLNRIEKSNTQDKDLSTESVLETICQISYEELIENGELLKQRIFKTVPRRHEISCVFAYGRQRPEDDFIAVGLGEPVEKFLLYVVYDSVNDRKRMRQEIIIDSENDSVKDTDIKELYLYRLGMGAVLFVGFFSGEHVIFRVGIDCSVCMILFEYNRVRSYIGDECVTYVGYNTGKEWNRKTKDLDWNLWSHDEETIELLYNRLTYRGKNS